MAASAAVFQNAFYVGNNFNAILYGVELVLYAMTIRTMFSPKHRAVSTDKFFLFFSTALVCLNTVFVATEAVFGQMMWVVNKDYPGGQDKYLNDFASVWYQTFGTAASIVLNLLSDSLLIYRCFVVWNDYRVIVLPALIYVGSFCVGVAQLIESGRPHSNYFKGVAQKLGVGYTSCIMSMNVLVTALICGKMYYSAREYERTLGHQISRTYTSAAAIVIESALPYTLFGVAYLVSFALKSDVSIFFLSVYVMFTAISPQMIILRVVKGRAWTRDRATMTTTARIEFTGRTDQVSTQIQFAHESALKHSHGSSKTQVGSSDSIEVRMHEEV